MRRALNLVTLHSATDSIAISLVLSGYVTPNDITHFGTVMEMNYYFINTVMTNSTVVHTSPLNFRPPPPPPSFSLSLSLSLSLPPSLSLPLCSLL